MNNITSNNILILRYLYNTNGRVAENTVFFDQNVPILKYQKSDILDINCLLDITLFLLNITG